MIVSFKTQLPLSFGVRKGWPYKRFLNHHLNKMRDNGQLQNILERNALKKHSCQTQDGPISIQITKMIFPFIVFLLGGTIAVSLVFAEKVAFGRLNSSKSSLTAHSNLSDEIFSQTSE